MKTNITLHFTTYLNILECWEEVALGAIDILQANPGDKAAVDKVCKQLLRQVNKVKVASMPRKV